MQLKTLAGCIRKKHKKVKKYIIYYIRSTKKVEISGRKVEKNIKSIKQKHNETEMITKQLRKAELEQKVKCTKKDLARF